MIQVLKMANMTTKNTDGKDRIFISFSSTSLSRVGTFQSALVENPLPFSNQN
jgi:hypothetical protein